MTGSARRSTATRIAEMDVKICLTGVHAMSEREAHVLITLFR